MLTKEALNSAVGLTDILEARGVGLTAVQQTPLGELVKATRSVDTSGGVVTSIIPTFDDILFMANRPEPLEGKQSDHDIVMEDVVTVAAKAVQGHIAFARNVVAPSVEELVSKVLESLSFNDTSSLLGMEVIVDDPASPYLNRSIERLVEQYKEVPYDNPALRMRMPDFTATEIKELLKTGSNSIDGDIEQWAAAKGDTFFMEIWSNLFQIKQVELNERIPVFHDFIDNRKNGAEVALGIFLLSRRMLDETPAGVEMDAKVFENTLVEFRNQAGARINRELEDIDRDTKNGMLVCSSNQNKIKVFGPVYRQWLEAGGSNEVLFGNLLKSPVLMTVSAINEHSTELLAAWNNFSSMTQLTERNKRFIRIKELFYSHFRQQMTEITDEERVAAGNVELILTKFQQLLSDVKEGDIDNIYLLALRLVCRSRFPDTAAEEILSGIEQAKKDNPALDVREAAAMSIIAYIADWVASQFTLKPI